LILMEQFLKLELEALTHLLEQEGRRIISLIPRIQPGMQNGKPVRVPFSIPITFKLQ